MIETPRISGHLIRQCQDRNHSSAYANDYVFCVHRHLLGQLDVREAKMFIGGSERGRRRQSYASRIQKMTKQLRGSRWMVCGTQL
jgi:hypothetical protein